MVYSPLYLRSLFLLILSLLTFSSLLQAEDREDKLENYLKLLYEHPKNLGPWGDFKRGEIEICTSKETVREVEEIQRQRLLRKGFSQDQAYESSRVGVVAEDQYWILIRDAVRFPSNFYGTYDRLLYKSALDEGPSGVAVLPMDEEGNFYLNVSFRHATRSWELEIPRGSRNIGEAVEKTAIREVKEETGLGIEYLNFLGTVVPDSGTICTAVPVFLGKVVFRGQQDQEFSEAILKVLKLSKSQLQEAFKRGYLEVPLHHEVIKVNVRDSFLSYSLYQASLHGLV